MSWIDEENWATSLMSDLARAYLLPKEKETAPSSALGTTAPTGAKVSFADWVFPAMAIGVVGVIVLGIFFAVKR